MVRKKLLTLAAAMLTGAMMLAAPLTAQAMTMYHPEVTPGAEAVTGFDVALTPYDRVEATWTNQDGNNKDIVVEWSTDPSFPNDNRTDFTSVSYSQSTELYNVEPGKTYYLRAFVRKVREVYDEDDDDYYYVTESYGPYSEVKSIAVPVPDVTVWEEKPSSGSVYFNFSNENVTGYEIYRSTSHKNYKKVAKISDTVYTDSGLTAGTTYNYKIRAYVYDSETKATSYGDWYYTSQTTWGSAIKLKATPASSTSVKLNWSKVSSASGYEVYRMAGSYSGNNYQSYFTNYKLIKTISKASTVSYTDKSLTSGRSYTYMVVAYRNRKSGKKTVRDMICMSGGDSVMLGFPTYIMSFQTSMQKDGSVKATWKKTLGASGYRVQKEDESGNYVDLATLPASATSYTFPIAPKQDGSAEYRIWAYSGAKKTETQYVTTENHTADPAEPSGITVSKTADGTGVVVSWKEVPGASFYQVYRSRNMGMYDDDAGMYMLPGSDVVYTVTPENKYGTYKITGTSVTDVHIDSPDPEDKYVINEGPKVGVRYYYYVQAYKSNGKPITDPEYYDAEHYSRYYTKPAGITLNNISLGTPKISSVKSTKAKQAVVSWKAVSGAKQYYVYYSTKKSSGYKLAGTTSKKSLTVKGLTSKKKYYFKVKAYAPNAVGADFFSGLSAAKNVKVK